MEQRLPKNAVGEDSESRELITILRGEIDLLPEVERNILALSCTSLTHREIAKLLEIPQRTVTDRIHTAIKRLRRGLTSAGVAIVTPLFNDSLFEAMTSGRECPEGMTERFKLRFMNSDRVARSMLSRRKTRTNLLWIFGTALVLAISTVAAWHFLDGRHESVGATPLTPSRIPASSNVLPISYKWIFNSPEKSGDFKVLEGSWRWISNGPGTGCMETAGGRFEIEPNATIPQVPLVITVRARVVGLRSNKEALLLGCWSDYKSHAIFRNVGRPAMVNPSQSCIMKQYLTTVYSDNWVDDQRTSLIVAEPTKEAHFSIIAKGGYQIEELAVRELHQEEAPDVHEYVDALEKISPEKRRGTVVVSELKSEFPGRPVTITFFDSK